MAIKLDEILNKSTASLTTLTESVTEHIVENVDVDLDAILLEWSYRCEKGYPDLNNKKDLAILNDILQEMKVSIPIKSIQEAKKDKEETPAEATEEETISVQDLAKALLSGKYSDKTLSKIKSLLSRSGDIEENISNNLIKNTLGSGDASHADEIIDIMLDGKTDAIKLNTYLENRTVSDTDFMNTPASILTAFKSTGLSNSAIEKLSVYRWPSTPVIGGCEVLLAVLLQGGSRPSQGVSGDLRVNNKPYEVKGNGARLKGQRGFGSPKAARAGFKYGYSELARSLGIQNVSLSGGAKVPENTLTIPEDDKRYGSSQETGWISVIEDLNKQLLQLTEGNVEKIELARAAGEGFCGILEKLSATDFDWIAKHIKNDGTLDRVSFYKEYAAVSFDYYCTYGSSDTPEMFVVTNITEGVKKPKPENAKILIFEANKAGFEKHVIKDIGIGLPSFSESAGVQGSVISLNLGQVNNFK
jgi:hypothetical protein